MTLVSGMYCLQTPRLVLPNDDLSGLTQTCGIHAAQLRLSLKQKRDKPKTETF